MTTTSISALSAGLTQVNAEVHRQSNAYDQLTGMIADLRHTLSRDGCDKSKLPVLMVRVQSASSPEEIDIVEFPLANLSKEDLHAVLLLFDCMLRVTHENLVNAWMSAERVVQEVCPQLCAASTSRQPAAVQTTRLAADHLPASADAVAEAARAAVPEPEPEGLAATPEPFLMPG